MEKIILKKSETKIPRGLASVVVRLETYTQVYQLALECGMTIESLVDLLLQEALKAVEVVDASQAEYEKGDSLKEIKAEDRRLFYDLYVHFNDANDWLMEKYKKLSEEKRRILKERGERLIHEAKCNGVKSIYYDSDCLSIFCALILKGYDFRI